MFQRPYIYQKVIQQRDKEKRCEKDFADHVIKKRNAEQMFRDHVDRRRDDEKLLSVDIWIGTEVMKFISPTDIYTRASNILQSY
jgi:hypothetical protein